MRALHGRKTKQSGPNWMGISVACLLTGMLAIALCARPGVRVSFAQSASTQSEAAQQDANAAQPSSAAEAKPAENRQGESGAGASNGQAPAQDKPAKQEVKAAATGAVEADAGEGNARPADPRQAEIVDDSANLLKLANKLKAEVDKTTQDTLSIAVIRQADEIERLAHKMRTK